MIKSVHPQSIPLDEYVLWSADALAHRLCISRANVHVLDKDEAIPAPVFVGGSKRWRADEIRSWVIHGCPLRDDWRWDMLAVPKLNDRIRELRQELDEVMREIHGRRRELASMSTANLQ